MHLHWPSVFLTCAAFLFVAILKSALTTLHATYASPLFLTTTSVVDPSTAPAVHTTISPAPTPMALEVEAYPAAPEELELRQVHVYVRHGERTPVSTRMSEPPAAIPAHWIECKTARAFHAAVHDVATGAAPVDAQSFFQSVLHPNAAGEKLMPVRRLVERRDGSHVEGECMLGELTDLGRRSTLAYGHALRKLYIDRLGFLPDAIERDRHLVYFRSTNMPRTIGSLEHIVYGLYPPQKFMNGVFPRILVRNGADENLVGNQFACRRLEVLKAAFAQAAADAWNPRIEHLDGKVSKYINGEPIRIDGKPRASGVLDTVKAAVAHGVRVPPEFQDPAVVGPLEKAVCAEWFSGCKLSMILGPFIPSENHMPTPLDKNEEFRRLGMGPLLDDLQGKMTLKADGHARQPRLLVHSTHDTALAGMLQTLDVFDERWPAFTASVTFELFRQQPGFRGPRSWLQSLGVAAAPSQPQHFVRMRYQNRSLELPFCAAQGNHLSGAPEFCTLEAFRARVRELTPADWDAECSKNVTRR